MTVYEDHFSKKEKSTFKETSDFKLFVLFVLKFKDIVFQSEYKQGILDFLFTFVLYTSIHCSTLEQVWIWVPRNLALRGNICF